MVGRRQRLRTFLNERFADSSELRTFVADHFESALARIPWSSALDHQSDALIGWLLAYGHMAGLWDALRAARPTFVSNIDALASEWPSVKVVAFNAGDQIGTTRLVRQLGAGPIGESWLADDINNAERVVVKIADADVSSVAAELVADLREQQVVSSSSFVPIRDVGSIDGRVFVVRAYVDAPSLKETLEARGPFSTRDAIDLLAQIARALCTVRVGHGALSMSNVFVESDDERESGLRVVLTELGFGTQLSNRELLGVDHGGSVSKVDMHALGVIGYWLAVGEMPLDDAQSIRGRVPDAPATLDRLLVRLQEPLATDRPKRMQDVAKLFELMRPQPAEPFGITAVAPEANNPERFVRTLTLKIFGAKQEFDLHSIRIGRDARSDVVIDQKNVSSRHGVLFHQGGVLRYQDTSRNGSTLIVGDVRREIAFEETVDVPLFGKLQLADGDAVIEVIGLGVGRAER